jgi:hypothetical protein
MTKSRRIRWLGDVAYMRRQKDAYKDFVGNPEEKRALGRPT